MARQYPYELWKLVTQPSTRTETGSTVAGLSTWVKHSQCRDETNGAARMVTLEDGASYLYESLIQLPKGCPTILRGTSIEVRQPDGFIRLKAKAVLFSPDQLHCRLWV